MPIDKKLTDSQRRLDGCKHVPSNPDALQTVCIKCSAEIEPTDRGSADRWRKI